MRHRTVFHKSPTLPNQSDVSGVAGLTDTISAKLGTRENTHDELFD